MFRQTVVAFALSLASIPLTGGVVASEATQPTARSDERTAYAFNGTGGASCDTRREHPDQSASVAIFANHPKHVLLHATGDRSAGTGHLIAYPVNRANGELGAQLWDASRSLPAAAARRIATTNSDGTPTAFRWADLDDGRRAQLQHDSAFVEYARGDTSNERLRLRQRADVHGRNRLGAILESSPVLVGPPSFAYRDELEPVPYSAFRRAYAQRPAYIFVGASDGMLHAIDARTGVEAFAVVPGELLSRIGDRLQSTGAGDAVVDGSPSVGDAFVGGQWRTVLLTGLGRGGRSIVALDVTDPENYASIEANPSRLILWEFTDAELGLTYSQPVVTRLQNGTWAAIFGNGYAAAARPILYVVELLTGRIIRKLDVRGSNYDRENASSLNGLSTPAVVDVNGDRIVEYVYAGDLRGNVWKFDLSSIDSAQWKTALEGEPLYQARSAGGRPQPVVLRPEVTRGPKGTGLFVLFAAGDDKRWTGPSTTSADHATLYGILDRNDGHVGGREQLFARTISGELAMRSARSEVRAARAIGTETDDATKGWYLDLPAADSDHHAEHVLTPPWVRDATVTLTTSRVRKAPCSADGTLWTTSLEIFGAEESRPVFDVNMDGRVDSTDMLNVEIEGQAKSMAANGVGVATSLRSLSGSVASMEAHTANHTCTRFLYVPSTSTEGIAKIARSCGGPRGRQSWRQVR